MSLFVDNAMAYGAIFKWMVQTGNRIKDHTFS